MGTRSDTQKSVTLKDQPSGPAIDLSGKVIPSDKIIGTQAPQKTQIEAGRKRAPAKRYGGK